MFQSMGTVDWPDILIDVNPNDDKFVPEDTMFPPPSVSPVSIKSSNKLSPCNVDVFSSSDDATSVASEYLSPTASPVLHMGYTPIKNENAKTPEVPSLPIRRRGPGRPSKVQLAAEGAARPSGRSLATMRRQTHNDSAIRSRAKFNTICEELWNEVPLEERAHATSKSAYPGRQICRAEKFEIVIAYVRRLQTSTNVH